jgi:hypothetical protein
MGGCPRAYVPRAILVSLLDRPQLRAPLGVIIGIVIDTVVGVVVVGGGGSLSSASFIVNANAALSTPVRWAAFVVRMHLVAEAAAAHPDWCRRRICRRGEAPSLSLESSVVDVTAAASLPPVRWATIVPCASLTANGRCLVVVTGGTVPVHKGLCFVPYKRLAALATFTHFAAEATASLSAVAGLSHTRASQH